MEKKIQNHPEKNPTAAIIRNNLDRESSPYLLQQTGANPKNRTMEIL